MKARWAIGAALAGALALGIAAHWRSAPSTVAIPPAPTRDDPRGADPGVPAEADSRAERGASTEQPEIPRGLRGTRPSGDLRTDAAGHFVPGPEALLLFDYYLSAANELPVEALTEQIQRAIRDRLAPPADAEAEAFLGDYLDYLAAGDSEFRRPGMAESADLERRFQWTRELRRKHFGPDLADRLFGDEERAAAIHLERRRLRTDPDLDSAARAERLAELEASYPEAQREARERATAPLRHAREEASLRASGASDAEIQLLREERFGAEAAERMQALDVERARWAARLEAYRAERDRRVAETADPVDRAARVDALRQESFTAGEARRVRGLEAAGALGENASPDAP